MAPKPKLSIQQMGEIRRRMAEANPPTQEQLAEEYGVARTTIRAALTGAPTPDDDAAGLVPDIIMLSSAEIVTSTLNPRKTFDEQAIAELAASIAANGLLQNLVARAAENGFYQIVAGERRFRAIRYLEEHGQWTDKFPCRVVQADAGAHLAMALLENLARVDVPPLEEAEAFVQLQAIDATAWSTANIAARIGKSARYVQQRMAFASKLSDVAKDAFRDGRLKIEGARLLSAAPHEAQDNVIQTCFDDGEPLTIDNIRGLLDEDFIPVSRALFNVEASGLETFDDDGDDYFVSEVEFWKHQDLAIEALREDRAKEWSFVKIIGRAEPKYNVYRDYSAAENEPRDQQGIVICVFPDGRVEEHAGLVKDPEPPSTQPVDQMPSDPAAATQEAAPFALTPPGKTAEPEAKGPPVTKSHIYHAHRRKTEALRAAVAKNSTLAMRCATFGLLTHSPSGPVTISPGYTSITEDKTPLTPAHERAINGFLGKTKVPQFWDAAANVKLWRAIESMPVEKLQMLFACVVARSVATPAGYQCELGDDPIALAIAHCARLPGNEDDHGLTVEREDLNGVRKPGLLGMADEAGTPAINDELAPGAIADAIAEKSKTYVLPTLRFATSAEIEKALKFR